MKYTTQWSDRDRLIATAHIHNCLFWALLGGEFTLDGQANIRRSVRANSALTGIRSLSVMATVPSS